MYRSQPSSMPMAPVPVPSSRVQQPVMQPIVQQPQVHEAPTVSQPRPRKRRSLPGEFLVQLVKQWLSNNYSVCCVRSNSCRIDTTRSRSAVYSMTLSLMSW